MSLCRLRAPFSPQLLKTRCFSSVLSNEEEYTSTPQYPKILDLSYKKRVERARASEHDEILKVKTVEEKQIKLNMPKYYGFKCHVVPEDQVPYNSLNCIQFITRTHLIVQEHLPDHYKSIAVDEVDLKSEVEEAILMELDVHRRQQELRTASKELSKADVENLVSNAISKQLNRVIVNKLSRKQPHLVSAQVDYDPRIETFWYVGGMNPTEKQKKTRRALEFLKNMVDEPVDRGFVYFGAPNLSLRSDLPLPPLLPASDCENPDLTVPHFQYDPRVLGLRIDTRFMANIPGFWPGEASQFGLISYHKRGHILERLPHHEDADDDQAALHYQGIIASFGWLHAQANLLGFNTFNDITYPMVTQTVITNGQYWSFYAYQLNTTLIHSKYATDNPKRNVCWGTPAMKLYEQVTDDGKLVGFNEDVLKILLQFYMNTPKARLGVNLRPYLSQEEKVVADYEHDKKRAWLEKNYKFLVSNRPRDRQIDEIYPWEKIYKIDHKTRFMEKRLRFFELFQDPTSRRLNEHMPEYIPRAHRPHLPRWKGRYADVYYP